MLTHCVKYKHGYKIIEEVSFTKPASHLQCQEIYMLTSHVNCLEETGHHVEAHGMWHMLLLNDCGIGQIKQRRHECRIMHCSMFHHEC